MRRLRLAVALLLLALPSMAMAVQPDEVLRDAALEARARALSRELRCMVCQNQSIDDSDAPLARDLRLLVRERLKTGDSDRQVLDFLVARYGDFVLLRPRLTMQTALLWGAPATLLLAGIVALLLASRRRAATAAQVPLTAAEQERVGRLLEAASPGGREPAATLHNFNPPDRTL